MKPTYYYIKVDSAEVVEVTQSDYPYTCDVVFPSRQMALVSLHTTLRKNCEWYQMKIDEIVQKATQVEREMEQLMSLQAAEEIHE